MPGINFSEESINQMYQLYSSMLGEVSAEAETFSRTVAEKARETQYLKMVELAARVLEYCSTVGEIYDIVVEDMIRQSAGLQG